MCRAWPESLIHNQYGRQPTFGDYAERLIPRVLSQSLPFLPIAKLTTSTPEVLSVFIFYSKSVPCPVQPFDGSRDGLQPLVTNEPVRCKPFSSYCPLS
jgi:hypothetical protein